MSRNPEPGSCSRWHHYSTIYDYAAVVVSFIKYLSEMGHPSYVPRVPKYRGSDFVPYVFTPEEMERIFTSCDEWRDKRHTVRNLAIIMPALLRLLYSTGMRVGEAVSIRNRDVDFERHVITLYHTKNGHERLAPLNESMESHNYRITLTLSQTSPAGTHSQDQSPQRKAGRFLCPGIRQCHSRCASHRRTFPDAPWQTL